MVSATGIIIVIIGILVVMGLVREGTEAVKDSPIMSTVESGKISFEKGKELVPGMSGSESFESDETNSTTLTELGQIPCTTDEDCYILSECEGATCLCVEGLCFVEN